MDFQPGQLAEWCAPPDCLVCHQHPRHGLQPAACPPLVQHQRPGCLPPCCPLTGSASTMGSRRRLSGWPQLAAAARPSASPATRQALPHSWPLRVHRQAQDRCPACPQRRVRARAVRAVARDESPTASARLPGRWAAGCRGARAPRNAARTLPRRRALRMSATAASDALHAITGSCGEDCVPDCSGQRELTCTSSGKP
jgi:hypothetical protein